MVASMYYKVSKCIAVQYVLPFSGAPFVDVTKAIATARSRLDYLASAPDRNARHGAKVLLKYKLLEWHKREIDFVNDWVMNTPALMSAAKQLNMNTDEFVSWLPQALIKSGAATIDGQYLVDKV